MELTLDRVEIGGTCKIMTVGGEGPLRRRLLDMGLTPRTEIRVVKAAPMGDPIELSLRDYSLTLRLDEAKKLTVSVVNEGGDLEQGKNEGKKSGGFRRQSL